MGSEGTRTMFESIILFCSCIAGSPTDIAVEPERPFEQIVADKVLAESAAGAGTVLTIGDVSIMEDAHTRVSFQNSGEVSRIEMDIWWGSTGAEMIAASVRAQL